MEGQEVAAPAVSEDSSLFSIDTAGAVKRDSPEEEVQLWTCALCQVTIKVRGDGRAEVTHVFGKPHRKKMRAAGLDEKAAEALVGICHNRDATEIQPIITTLKRKADDSLASVPKSMRSADGSTSAKSILNELCQRMHWSVSFTIDQRGEHHCPDFMATAALNRGSGQDVQQYFGEWTCNKRAAETAAAAMCLHALEKEGYAFEPIKNDPNTISRGTLRWLMTNAKTPEELLGLNAQHEARLLPEHLACTWNRLAHMTKESRFRASPGPMGESSHPGVARLVSMMTQSLEEPDESKRAARSCSPTAAQAARTGIPPPPPGTVPHGSEWIIPPPPPGTVPPPPPGTVPPPPPGTVPLVPSRPAYSGVEWGSRELANVVHGMVVTLGLPADGHRQATYILELAVERAIKIVNTFRPMELANLVWGIAKACHGAPTLMQAVEQHLCEQLEGKTWAQLDSSRNVSGERVQTYLPDGRTVFRKTAPDQGRTAKAAQHANAAPALKSVAGASQGPPDSAPTTLQEVGAEGAPLSGDVEELPVMGPQELTNLLYSYAKAGVAAPNFFVAFACYWASPILGIDDSIGGVAAPVPVPVVPRTNFVTWSLQDLVSTMWACTQANERHERIVDLMIACEEQLWARVDEINPKYCTQLQQWLIWWQVELGYETKSPLFTPEFRVKCRNCMAAGDSRAVGGHTVSALQASVWRAFNRMGIHYFNSEFTTPEGYSVDLADIDRRLAIEVDGPHHYNQLMQPTGPSLLKRRQLRATGWAFISIPYFEWYSLDGDLNAECAYLAGVLSAPAFPTKMPKNS